MKYEELRKLVESATHITVLQADNPDGDSLGSSLALEAILTELGKKVSLVCAVDMPQHLRYLSGWDRVGKDIPRDSDMSIVVDSSTESLFEYFERNGSLAWLKTKPL
jgi:nanoRNase/pAp phosphatase (c-di-AMP/oligoRNAs hydrolase)